MDRRQVPSHIGLFSGGKVSGMDQSDSLNARSTERLTQA